MTVSTSLSQDEFLTLLFSHITDHIKGGYFMNPEEDEDGYNHDELQSLIEQFCDEKDFDIFETDLSWQSLADQYEPLIWECFDAGLVNVE